MQCFKALGVAVPCFADHFRAMQNTDHFDPRLDSAETWIFDLDNTLYPASCNLFAQIDVKMGSFISNYLNIDLTDARVLQKEYFRNHGTTLNGLMQNHGLEPKLFLDFVHDIDYAPVAHNPDLVDALNRLPGRKVIFTNGTVPHAEAVLDRLGISHVFEVIFDIVASDYVPKPNPGPYDKLLDEHDIDPSKSVMVEDMARNLEHPAAIGMQTVWVRTDHAWSRAGAEAGEHVHHITDDLATWLSDYVGQKAA